MKKQQTSIYRLTYRQISSLFSDSDMSRQLFAILYEYENIQISICSYPELLFNVFENYWLPEVDLCIEIKKWLQSYDPNHLVSLVNPITNHYFILKNEPLNLLSCLLKRLNYKFIDDQLIVIKYLAEHYSWESLYDIHNPLV